MLNSFKYITVAQRYQGFWHFRTIRLVFFFFISRFGAYVFHRTTHTIWHRMATCAHVVRTVNAY